VRTAYLEYIPTSNHSHLFVARSGKPRGCGGIAWRIAPLLLVGADPQASPETSIIDPGLDPPPLAWCVFWPKSKSWSRYNGQLLYLLLWCLRCGWTSRHCQHLPIHRLVFKQNEVGCTVHSWRRSASKRQTSTSLLQLFIISQEGVAQL
jgi:hypothetical protein